MYFCLQIIYNNITLWDSEISEGDVMAAAKYIGVDRFISKLPGKLQYDVKERGAMLSSGQRQLIAFLGLMFPIHLFWF